MTAHPPPAGPTAPSSRPLSALVGAVAVLGVLVGGCADTAEPSSEPVLGATLRDADPGGARRARQLLAEVTVVDERPQVPGYDRDCGPGDGCVFGPDWSDDTRAPLSRNGCDTRNDVLARTLGEVRYSRSSPGCDVTGGTLVDPYTGRTMDYATEGSEIHVDHVFPLAAAWDLGAATWTPARRATFANDPTLELLAVSGTANLAKGDSTLASWLPPDTSFRCAYVTAYLEVAHAYDLALTATDVRVIEPVLQRRC